MSTAVLSVQTALPIAALALGSYLLGAVPFALILGKWFAGIDIRRHGSGNIGATNLLRAAGRRLGITAFGLDFAKGLGPVLLAGTLAAQLEAGKSAFAFHLGAACGTVLGHMFPVYLGFRGGKGVATGAGAMVGLAPVETAVALVIWTIAFLATRLVAFGSILAAASLPASVWLLGRHPEDEAWLLPLTVSLALLVVVRHRTNIRRMLAGRELRM